MECDFNCWQCQHGDQQGNCLADHQPVPEKEPEPDMCPECGEHSFSHHWCCNCQHIGQLQCLMGEFLQLALLLFNYQHAMQYLKI